MNKTYRANEADTSCADMQVKRLLLIFFAKYK